MDKLFDLTGISYSYPGNFRALNDVTLSIRPGEKVSILGSNGSGKSTLLSILDALIFPDSGSFSAFGNPVRSEMFDSLDDNPYSRFFRKKVGFVFQNSDVQLFSSTVYDEIAFGPLQLDLDPDEVKARTEEVMEMMGITKLRDRAPHTLSGGEKKKVCIASVLSVNPDVLLLDEPTSGLDPRSKFWLTEFLSGMGRTKKTIITATHDLETVTAISDRALVFGEEHNIVADKKSQDIMEDTQLLASTNLIHSHIHSHGSFSHVHYHYHEGEHMHGHEGDCK
ncbi:cobalt/nickel transport system ATP-binding protein [Methanomicrobium sp. W14]|uniref:energy-coupling factor ABC transporter ATP-binding protein n=1 Tax=Methanomicrobium sp. W14 TaxID=2817839 RepID=UPI001AEAD8FF|nr:ABC transporter ATP-binding protein [Methanomicrobium sp. W14]MBP2133231.1 cobalt/nickel transport system ATP-binding protein [Methanomicrobium sp. W14]